MLTVRRASTDDLECITAAYVNGWRKGFAHLYPVVTFLADDFEQRRALEAQSIVYRESDTYVVERQGRVVGFCDIVSDGDIDEFEVEVNGTPTFSAIWLHPHAWGSGAGQTLLAHVDDEARSAGVDSLSAWIPEDSPRARRLFEKTGWRPTGEIGHLAFEPGDDNRTFEYRRALL